MARAVGVWCVVFLIWGGCSDNSDNSNKIIDTGVDLDMATDLGHQGGVDLFVHPDLPPDLFKPDLLPCGPKTCMGCCDSSGLCNDGQSNSSCGESGAPCKACASGQECAQRTCIKFVSCTYKTCTLGCCSKNDSCLDYSLLHHTSTCGSYSSIACIYCSTPGWACNAYMGNCMPASDF